MAEAAKVITVAPLSESPVFDDLVRNWGEVATTMKRMCAYYGYDGDIPEHILNTLANERELPEAELRTKVLKKLHIHLLMKWAKGEIMGPRTPDNLAAMEKKALANAAYMRRLRKPEDAEKWTAKAEEYRKMADSTVVAERWW